MTTPLPARLPWLVSASHCPFGERPALVPAYPKSGSVYPAGIVVCASVRPEAGSMADSRADPLSWVTV